ncbi:MAG: ATP-binding protein [Pseudomonadales bacterium]
MPQNTPVLILLGQGNTATQLDELFQRWPYGVSAPIICCAFNPSQEATDKPENISLPNGYQVEHIGADLTHELKNYRLYFAETTFKLTRRNFIWTYEAVLTPEVSSAERILANLDQTVGGNGIAIQMGLQTPNFQPTQSLLLSANSEAEIRQCCTVVEICRGPRSPLISRLLNQAIYSISQHTGINIDHFRLTWLLEHGFFKDLSSEQMIEQYSSVEDAAGLVSRLLEKNQSHVWPREIIERVCERIEKLVNQTGDEPVKVWLAGGHVRNVVAILEQLAESENLSLINRRLRIQLTATTQNKVEQLKEATRQVQQKAGGSYLSPVQTLWRNCVFHSRHNILADAPYRYMNLIVVPWIFPALKPVIASTLFKSFASSQAEGGEILVAREELASFDSDSYLPQVNSPFLLRQEIIKRTPGQELKFPAPPDMDSELGTAIQFRINDRNQIIDVRGNTQLFLQDGSTDIQVAQGKQIDKILRIDVVDSVNNMLSHVIGHAPRKKLIVAKDQVMICTMQTQVYNQQPCTFVSIEIIEDVDLQTRASEASPEAQTPQSVQLITQEKSRAFNALERLSIQLAADNDNLQSELEPLKKELEVLRTEHHELSQTVVRADQQQKLADFAIEHAHIALAVTDDGGTILSSNRMFRDLMSVDQVDHLTDRRLGLPVDKLIPLLSNCFNSGTPGELDFLERSSGKQYQLRVGLIPGDGNKLLIQLQPAEANATQTDFMQSLQQIKIGAVVLDQQHNIQFVDDRVADWHQADSDDLLHTSFISLIHPGHRGQFTEALDDASHDPVDLEVPLLRKNSDPTWVRIRSLAEDHTDQIMLLIENIRRRKQDEKQTKITQKLELLGQITGGVAHDFNNILAIIIGYIDLMNSDISALQPQDTERYLAQMKDASERARTLVKQLLLYSKGDKKSTLTKLSVAEGIEETLPLIRTSLQEHIYLTTNISARNAHIEMDPAHLHQILMNLCINARDAVDEVKDRDGEIIIGVSDAEPIEDIECVSCHAKITKPDQSHFVVLTVTDNGPGIAADTIEQMFDPFFTTKSDNKGSGMGLSVVHGLVHQYGGHLQVLTSNFGVQFRVWLPTAIPEPDTAKIETIATGTTPKFSWRILVVEDDPDVAAVLSKLLAYLDVEVVHQENGQVALALLTEDQNFQLVISDQNMPLMSGTDLAERCLEVAPDLPFLILSGNALSIEESKLPTNVVQQLEKPVTTADLTNAMNQIAARQQIAVDQDSQLNRQ